VLQNAAAVSNTLTTLQKTSGPTYAEIHTTTGNRNRQPATPLHRVQTFKARQFAIRNDQLVNYGSPTLITVIHKHPFNVFVVDLGGIARVGVEL